MTCCHYTYLRLTEIVLDIRRQYTPEFPSHLTYPHKTVVPK